MPFVNRINKITKNIEILTSKELRNIVVQNIWLGLKLAEKHFKQKISRSDKLFLIQSLSYYLDEPLKLANIESIVRKGKMHKDLPRNWDMNDEQNEKREQYLARIYNSLIKNLNQDPNSDISITGGTHFGLNEIETRLLSLQFNNINVYETTAAVLKYYSDTNYIEKCHKKYDKIITVKALDILSDFPQNVSFISNDVHGGDFTTIGLPSYRNLELSGSLQIVNAMINKNIQEVAWLINTHSRPKGKAFYIEKFRQMQRLLDSYGIYCKYEIILPETYSHGMFSFGGVFKTRKQILNKILQKTSKELLVKELTIENNSHTK